MKHHQTLFLFLLLVSILPTESKATQCTEPARTTCVNSCVSSTCRAQCERTYCGADATSPGAGGAAANHSLNVNYGVPLYYGPFFPGFGPDQLYLNSLLQDLQRQRDEILQFRQIVSQYGDSVLTYVADSALQDVQQRMSQIQAQLYASNDYYYRPYGGGYPVNF
jgi:hypothetical protein